MKQVAVVAGGYGVKAANKTTGQSPGRWARSALGISGPTYPLRLLCALHVHLAAVRYISHLL